MCHNNKRAIYFLCRSTADAKSPKQGYVAPRMKSLLQKFYDGHHELK